MGLEGQRLLLLVADAAGDVREHRGIDEGARRVVRGAHPVDVDHRLRDVGDALEVVRGAGRDLAEDELLGDAAAEQHGHLVDQLVARLQVAVLVGQVHDVAERLPAGDDRDLVDALGRLEQLAAERVAGLVIGDDAPLVVVERRRGLDARDDALERLVEVAHRQRVALAARAADRRLVADVREVGARQAARLLGDDAEVDVLEQRLVARVHLEDRACARRRPAARRRPGGRSAPGAAAPRRASRAGSKRRSRRPGRLTRSRPSRRAAG